MLAHFALFIRFFFDSKKENYQTYPLNENDNVAITQQETKMCEQLFVREVIRYVNWVNKKNNNRMLIIKSGNEFPLLDWTGLDVFPSQGETYR